MKREEREEQEEIGRLGYAEGLKWREIASNPDFDRFVLFMRHVKRDLEQMELKHQGLIDVKGMLPFSFQSQAKESHLLSLATIIGAGGRYWLVVDESGAPQHPEPEKAAEEFWQKVAESVPTFDSSKLENPNYPWGFALGVIKDSLGRNASGT